MTDLVNDPALLGSDQPDMSDVLGVRKCPIGFVPVRAKDRVLRHDRLEHFGDRGFAEVFEHFVRHLPVTVPRDQNRNLLCRQSPLRGLATPFAGCAPQIPRTFERFQEEGLVGLDYPLEAAVLLVPQPMQETVTPPEAGGCVDPAFPGRLADTQAVNHRPGILQPLLLFPQARQGGPGDCVEGLQAALATVALHPVCGAPPLKLIMIAMRAVSAHADALLKGLCDGLTFILDSQGIGQLPFLCRAQPLKTQKILFEFSMIHLLLPTKI